jgi:DNA repair exonuclease SbcCD ATPase subunit
MTNRGIRLTARAFNNECDSAIVGVKWNNVDRMEQRIEKAFDSINKLNESNALFISDEYLSLKIKELRLAYEYKEKKQQEKEEQSEIRQQMRDEAQLIQEVEKAQKDEEKYQKLLTKATVDAEKATGSKLEKLMESIEKLKQDLEEAHSKNERAKSMAQQTKSGHVYVISNIGSFGEDVYKIGMTRRLEPLDRVKELGDASVPFIFDVHAMMYSEDAPSLENTLHKILKKKLKKYQKILNL